MLRWFFLVLSRPCAFLPLQLPVGYLTRLTRLLSSTNVPFRTPAYYVESADTRSKDLSFPTIAGSDSNGAIIHYSAERGSCRTVGQDSMLLLDSGAQVRRKKCKEGNIIFFCDDYPRPKIDCFCMQHAGCACVCVFFPEESERTTTTGISACSCCSNHRR